jgi:thiol-disulfide isomerase/thioredoxin
MKKSIAFILLCFLCLKAQGQNAQQSSALITVPLKVINGDSSWMRQDMLTSTIDKPDNYILPGNYKTYRVAAVTLSRAQEYYERFHQGKITAEAFNKLSQAYNIDTSILYHGILKGNHINVFTAIDSVNKYVIVDANNNYSFLDDKVYVFPLKNRLPDTPKTYVSITKYNGNQKTTFSVPVYINAFDVNGGKTELEKSLDVSLIAGSMRLGEIKVNGKTYLVGLDNRNFGMEQSHNKDYHVTIRQSPLNENDINDYFYLPYENIDIGGNIYRIQQVTDEAITLAFIKKRENAGGGLYTKAPEFDIQDVMTGKPYKLDLHSGKYTIIDFWGSWCEPCIEELPLLVSTHDKYLNKVNFVSIAVDYSKNIEKLKGLITQNNLVWPQVWVDRHERDNNPVSDYKVVGYPTTVLLDGNGTIIYRGIGADALENIIKILQNKLGG